MSATFALAIALLVPANANAFVTFSNGVLTIEASEGKIVPRCASNGGGLGSDSIVGGNLIDRLIGGPGKDAEKQ